VHANSATDVPARLEALALAAGLGRDALHSQVHAGLDAVVHLVRDRGGQRRVDAVHVLERVGDLVESRPALWFRDGTVTGGPALPELRRRLGVAG
jgi:pilus assembly protein CpaF